VQNKTNGLVDKDKPVCYVTSHRLDAHLSGGIGKRTGDGQMGKFEIKHRITGAVIFECELDADVAELSYGRQLGFAVKQAIKARANLAGANLARAYLAGAYLAGANLADANLAGANLAGAYLAGANLADANLAGANLAGANLAGANLAGANLAGANLAGAYLARAYLADAYLARANLARAYLAGANLAGANLAGADLADANLARAYLADADLADARNLPSDAQASDPPEPYERATKPEHYAKRAERFRQRNPDVPVIPALDQQILSAIESGSGHLDMSQWHTCETTHCRAGWAITLAGEVGKQLEREHGPHIAGRMIYSASTGRVPHFFASNEHAMEDIKARAAEQVAS
jgi:uncharacterized protein YjbI with pentapeptide repeats